MMLKADRQTYLENVKKLKRDRDQMNNQMMMLMNSHQALENLQREGFIDENA